MPLDDVGLRWCRDIIASWRHLNGRILVWGSCFFKEGSVCQAWLHVPTGLLVNIVFGGLHSPTPTCLVLHRDRI
jgi:hypothetical protein